MDSSEADSRFGATALRTLDDALALAAREPRVALTAARKAVEAVALHLYARDVGDPDASPKRLMLDDLLKALSKQKLIPEGVGMHFGTVQRYGNYGSHPQSDDASVGNTVAFNQPCIESLRFIARWYVKDKLRLAEDETPPNIRVLALATTAPAQEPAPSATGPRVGAVTSPTTPSAADPFGLVGARLEEKYQIGSMVAEGGFGAVYRGTHLTLDKPLAIKVLKSPPGATDATRDAFIEGFALEAKTIARMEHPAIVKVLDFGVSVMPTGAPAPWMVLEWLTGDSLAADLARRRGHPGRAPAEALELLRPILQAVAYAHAEGIAHRDIKPANIMLPAPQPIAAVGATGPSSPTTRPRMATGTFGRRGELAAKLLDFGIAKIMRSDETEASGHTRTQSSLVAFSLPYAAPEQISGTRTGPWTDVHALALVLVELLVNQAPYTATDAQELYMAVLSPVRPTPARFGLDAGPWEPVLARALAPRPSDRYPSAADLLDALEAEVPAALTPLTGAAPTAQWQPPGVSATVLAPAPHAETLRGAQVPAPPPQRSKRGALVGAAAGAAVLAGLLVALGASSSSSSSSPSSPAPTPRAHAATTPSAAPSAAPAPTPSAAPAPTPSTAAVAQASPVGAAPVEASAEAPEEPDSRRRGRRRHRASHARDEASASASARTSSHRAARIHAD